MLVAGGGPVGLAAAVELGRRGVSCLVIEPREEVSHARPRCKTVNVRTMEHLRRWGIADRFRAAAPLPVSWSKDIVFCTSLAGYELSRFTGVLGLALDGDRFPETGQQAPQYVLEELLRDVVTELPGCTLAAGLRVTSVEQDPDAVRVTVQDPAGGQVSVEADYLLGCDGPRSTVRDQIGARYVGEFALRPNFGMVFFAPGLWPQVRHGPAVQFWIVNDRTPAVMGPMDRNGTWWIIALDVSPELGRRTAASLIEGAAGVPVDAQIRSDDPWTARMQLVDRLRSGRVFLAGDAAHLNPPFGGHGLNTGIGDAVDLGWKLAAVLDGWGGEQLLASYEAERRPIQDRVIREASENMKTLSTDLTAASLEDDTEAGQQARRAADRRIQQDKTAEFHSLDLVLDLCYDRSPLVVPALQPGPQPAARPAPQPGARPAPQPGARPAPQPGARPGARLPHVWLAPGRSVYDSLGPGMTLLVLDAPAGSWQPLVQAASKAGVPLHVLDLRPRDLRQRYGAGLVLVRPDQHVAWCAGAPPADPMAIIDRARGARLLCDLDTQRREPLVPTPTPTPALTRDEIISRNIAAVDQHFHNENPEGIDLAVGVYTDDIVWEVPARGLVHRDRETVKQEYLKIFGSMNVHKITNLHRFATEEWVFDDSIFEFTVGGDGFTNCPFPPGTRVSMRLVHAFQCRDGKICRENGYEIWRRADDERLVRDDIPADAVIQEFA